MTTPQADPRQPIDDPRDEADQESGDTHAADIVGRTGEEMPVQHHAEVHEPAAPPRDPDDRTLLPR